MQISSIAVLLLRVRQQKPGMKSMRTIYTQVDAATTAPRPRTKPSGKQDSLVLLQW
jgi:hypothetical protein